MRINFFIIIISITSLVTAQVTWTKNPTNLVLSKILNQYEGIAIGSPSVISDNDTLKMLYAAGGVDTKGRISYAYSLDGTHWTNYNAATPIFDVSSDGNWDSHFLDTPDWLKDNMGYKLYYFGDRDNNSIGGAIGLAESDDGIHWNRVGTEPILSPGNSGEWDELYIESPSVLYDGTTYFMWYSGINANYKVSIGVATSPDGIHWTKNNGNPVIDTDSDYSWEGLSVATPTIIKKDEHFEMWYCGASYHDFLDNDVIDTIKIGYATSLDGLTWTKYAKNPIMDTYTPPYAENEERGPWTPDVIFKDETYYMWYETAHGFGLATSTFENVAIPSVKNNSNNFLIYPNPAKNRLTIDFDNRTHRTIQIRNLQGIVMVECDVVPQMDINLTPLSKGIYLVTLTGMPSLIPQKLIVD